ncbi:unnamed protein product [Pneumocystis jirovecii]|uniref:Uncharacterized protein n=1 Tax=Pneumocystis jirovecii TaxID=42068 RepID=L0PEC8_PNEJI|nr:unnamed protein product [Pneumocystis jirovecii]
MLEYRRFDLQLTRLRVRGTDNFIDCPRLVIGKRDETSRVSTRETNAPFKRALCFSTTGDERLNRGYLAAVPTSALQVEELTPTLIFPRETCLDMLSKHSSCSGSSEVDLCCSGHASGLQNGGTGESSVSPSSPFFNRIYTGTHSHGFLEQDGYVSFPPLDLYQQDKRSTPVLFASSFEWGYVFRLTFSFFNTVFNVIFYMAVNISSSIC